PNKHLLPVLDRPMIYYPLQTLINAGIKDILIVTGGPHAGDFLRLLGNGGEFGLTHLNYTYQEGEGGIAAALALGEHFADGGKICVMLGDNLIEGSIAPAVGRFRRQPGGARIVLKEGEDAERLGVTGAAGFIGTNFVRHALARSADAVSRLVAVDLLTYAGNYANLADLEADPRFRFVRADIADRDAMATLVDEEAVDTLVNCA